MSIPALLLSIFAPVLSAIVRVRIGAVLSALIVAVSLSVAAPAEARWEAKCESDAWDDTPSCRATAGGIGKRQQYEGTLLVNQLQYFCDGAGKQEVSLSTPRVQFQSYEVPFAGFATAEGKWNSGGEFRLHKFQTRWDKESPGDGAFLQPSESDVNDYYSDKKQYYWQWRDSDWWGWKALEATPASSNPIRLLQTKSQLRIRTDSVHGTLVFTYSLKGAAEAIAKAKRGCGL